MEIIKPANYSCATIYKMKKAEIEKIDFSICAQPRETLESFYKRQTVKPDVLCNGGFFSMSDGSTIFTFVDEGREISVNKTYLEGFGITGNKELTLSLYNKNYRDFINGYPVLMKGGRLVSTSIGSEINYKARRTILGMDNTYIYLIAVEDPGYAFNTVKRLLQELGVIDAINLDGGGSTRVLVNGERKTANIYSRPVDNVVAFYFKKEEKKTIYRVQTGAFSKRENAEAYCKQIQNIPDAINAGYKNAYIRFIDGLYKVQVGAFGVKANAERVLNDLKNKGYSAFITTK